MIWANRVVSHGLHQSCQRVKLRLQSTNGYCRQTRWNAAFFSLFSEQLTVWWKTKLSSDSSVGVTRCPSCPTTCFESSEKTNNEVNEKCGKLKQLTLTLELISRYINPLYKCTDFTIDPYIDETIGARSSHLESLHRVERRKSPLRKCLCVWKPWLSVIHWIINQVETERGHWGYHCFYLYEGSPE